MASFFLDGGVLLLLLPTQILNPFPKGVSPVNRLPVAPFLLFLFGRDHAIFFFSFR